VALTFKDLRKRVTLETTILQQQQQQSKAFELLRNKPFWIWDIEEHKQEDARTKGNCCFNHIIGLPAKGKTEKPIFDYEKLLYDSLLDNEHSNVLSPNFTLGLYATNLKISRR
jgi:hypothetical protein